MKLLCHKEDIFLLPKQKQNSKQLRKANCTLLLQKNQDDHKKSVGMQADMCELVASARNTGQILATEYSTIIPRNEDIKERLEKTKSKIINSYQGEEKKSYEELRDIYSEEYGKFTQQFKLLKDELEHDLETSGSILSNIDASRERPTLDFNLFPPNLVEKEDIVLSYDGLLNSCLQIIKQAEQLPAHQQWEKFPQQDVGFGVESIEGLKTGVKESTIQLEEMKNQLTSSVNLLSKQSGEVDWISLLQGEEGVKEKDSLLPPTPIIIKVVWFN
ncbi:uncharacterized protein LOC111708844 [Eurytemora carolleeae]|uniref:uncharacterized protein LOC111708844 n=1 Tax=Eurytemora carolleeae TaxID=1294199 RepID=UPI000C76C668|nr:uncharacterized protein LOC111708844 [Eurytemora carolleeae]|eukprot:XP_023338114.1 uncharacterized protein LOC111708844 [Eurytemora affinis]